MEIEELRSLHSREETLVHFINLTDRYVDLIWINFDGRFVKYREIPPKHALHIKTFKSHPWIALDSVRRDRLWINKEFVYMPETRREYLHRRGAADVPSLNVIAVITLPVYSLKYLTLLELRSYFRECAQVDGLDLPVPLINNLKSLIRQRNSIPQNFIT